MEFVRFLLFTLISSVEYIALIIFAFTLFRINPRWYKPQMLFVCVSLSYVSFTMRGDDLAFITPFIQLAVLIVLLWLMFQIHPGYAALVAVIGYFAYGLLQGALLLVLGLFGVHLQAMTLRMYGVALLTSLIMFGVSYMLKRRNRGFSFVPHSDEVNFGKYSKRDKMLMSVVVVLLILGTGIVFCAYYFTLLLGTWLTFLLALCVLFIEVCILFYYSRKREEEANN